MFRIINANGSNIGEVDEDELHKLMKDGLIRYNDTVIDIKTGERVK